MFPRHLLKALPALFEFRHLPPGWLDDYAAVPVNPHAREPDTVVESLGSPVDGDAGESLLDQVSAPRLSAGGEVEGVFPGAPQVPTPPAAPPPDTLAFYLPFHLYRAEWGVYLLAEGVHYLAERIWRAVGQAMSYPDATWVARLFLYSHQEFHHMVEAFSARLEMTHRDPLYRTRFTELYASTVGTDSCREEALATAWGYRRLRSWRSREQPPWLEAVCEALRNYIEWFPPGYRRALEYLSQDAFTSGRCDFLEGSYKSALPDAPPSEPGVWCADPGFSRGHAMLRATYLVRKASPLHGVLGLE